MPRPKREHPRADKETTDLFDARTAQKHRQPERPHKTDAASAVPLSEARYCVKGTVSSRVKDKLTQAQQLLGGRAGKAEFEQTLEAALDLLIAKTLKTKYGVGVKPKRRKKAKAPANNKRSRAIPAHVKRAVWTRDEGRCAYVDERGRRCNAETHLEFHHKKAFAQGGSHAISNVELLCAAHNAEYARQDFGAEHVAMKIAQTRGNVAKASPAKAWRDTLERR